MELSLSIDMPYQQSCVLDRSVYCVFYTTTVPISFQRVRQKPIFTHLDIYYESSDTLKYLAFNDKSFVIVSSIPKCTMVMLLCNKGGHEDFTIPTCK